MASEKKLKEASDIVKEKETTKLLEGNRASRFVKEAEKFVEECKVKKAEAKATAEFVKSACEHAESGVIEDDAVYQMMFVKVTEGLQKETVKESAHAQDDFYKVKDKNIGLKTEVAA